jgi:hypothetical protein
MKHVFNKSFFLILSVGLLASCNQMNDRVDQKLQELNTKATYLDSIITKEVDKVMQLDSIINIEGEKIKKLDSLVDKSTSKIDSIAKTKMKTLKNLITN